MTIDAGFNEDFLVMRRALDAAKIEHVLIGAQALASAPSPEATGSEL